MKNKSRNLQSIPKKSKLGKKFIPDNSKQLFITEGINTAREISPQERIKHLEEKTQKLHRKVEQLGEAGHMILRGIGVILNRYED